MKVKKLIAVLTCTIIAIAMFALPVSAAPSPVEGKLVVKVDHNSVTNLEGYGGMPTDFNGFLGTIVKVGDYPLTVTSLGRLFYEGNSQSHELKLVEASTGKDVEGASVKVSGGKVDEFTFAKLASPVTLKANTTYYLLSKESSGGDFFSDSCDFMYSDSAAVCTGFVRQENGEYKTYASPNGGYVSLNMEFTYTPNETPEGKETDLFMDVKYDIVRNDYHSFIGLKISTGKEDMVVTELGRFWLEGNKQEHVVKIVDAETREDVPGASVIVKSGTANKFSFVKLQTPVTLKANHMYWLLSREYFEGDTFIEGNSQYLLTDEKAATLLGGSWLITGYEDQLNLNMGFAGLNLRYLAKETAVSSAPAPATSTTESGKNESVVSSGQSGTTSQGGSSNGAGLWIAIAVVAVVVIAGAVTAVILVRKKKQK